MVTVVYYYSVQMALMPTLPLAKSIVHEANARTQKNQFNRSHE